MCFFFLCFKQTAESPEQVWLTTSTASLIIIFSGNCSARSQLEHHHVQLSAHRSVEKELGLPGAPQRLVTADAACWRCFLHVAGWCVCCCANQYQDHIWCEGGDNPHLRNPISESTEVCENIWVRHAVQTSMFFFFFNWPDFETLESIICGCCTTGGGKSLLIIVFWQFGNRVFTS